MASVYLTGKYAPGDKDWHTGTIRKDASGVWVEDYQGEHFYPYDKVQRISP